MNTCRVRQFAVIGLSALAATITLRPAQFAQAAPSQTAPTPRLVATGDAAGHATAPRPVEGDYVVADFRFDSGQTLQSLRLHYTTLGEPRRDSSERAVNAVLILHGTGGSGHSFLNPNFAGVLFGPGELLDASRYFIILPDDIGHGRSSKPSDGMRAKFPDYDYGDMVRAEHLIVTRALHVDHLRLIAGTSMGCMHTWMWAERYPQFMDAALPLACLPIQISGRNRMIRRMTMDSIRDDPAWDGGNYTKQPESGLRGALNLLFVLTSAPLYQQKLYPTQQLADEAAEAFMKRELATTDANDMLYQFNSSRDYDPSARLGSIETRVMAINSADDQVNPPELGIMPSAIRKVRRGEFVLLPITDQTRGHGTHSLPAIWKPYLAKLLEESRH